jgi:SAM-dependent methyltransferase
MHGTEAPSSWVTRWTHLLAPQSHVLDLACGAGRHMGWFAKHGHQCVGVDRSPEALQAAKAFGQVIEADIEGGPWPLLGQTFDAVIVTNYLWRPLMSRILESLKPQGVLIYETFALGHEKIGKPSRPDCLRRRVFRSAPQVCPKDCGHPTSPSIRSTDWPWLSLECLFVA